MGTITRFHVRSNGRDVTAVRRPGGGGAASSPPVVVTPAPAEMSATITESDYTRRELIEMAEARGLDSSGNKAELVERLNG